MNKDTKTLLLEITALLVLTTALTIAVFTAPATAQVFVDDDGDRVYNVNVTIILSEFASGNIATSAIESGLTDIDEIHYSISIDDTDSQDCWNDNQAVGISWNDTGFVDLPSDQERFWDCDGNHISGSLPIGSNQQITFSSPKNGTLYWNVDDMTGTISDGLGEDEIISGSLRECQIAQITIASSEMNCGVTPGPGIPSATIEIRDTNTGALEDTATTDSSGDFNYNVTTPGSYDFIIKINGETRRRANRLSISSGDDTDLYAVMKNPALQDNTASPSDDAEATYNPQNQNVELSIDLEDADFPSDTVDVEFFDASDDTKIGTNQTLTSDDTASLNWDIQSPGWYRWYATATDNYTYTTIDTTTTFQFQLTRDEVSPWSIDNPSASPRDNEVIQSGSHTLSIDINDMNNTYLNVSFYDEDNQFIDSQEINGDDTQTASITRTENTAGTYGWYARVKDLNTSVQRTSNFFQYGISGGLNIRDKDNGDLINDRQINVTVTWPNNQTQLTTNDGTVSWSNLPEIPQGEFSVDIETTGYFDQSLTLSTTADTVDIYLANSSGVPDTDRLNVIFTLEDRTGDFSPVSEAVLTVEERVNTAGSNNQNFKEIASGEFGAANQYQVTLTRNTEYLLSVRNNNNTRELGSFKTNVSGTFNLVIDTRDYTLNESRTWTWNASLETDPANQIEFNYNDTANETKQITIDIYEYGNESNVLESRTVTGTWGLYQLTTPLTTEQAGKAWVVSFCAQRADEEVCGEKIVGEENIDILNFIPTWLQELISVVIIFLTAGVFSPLNAKMGAVSVTVVAGLLFYIGLLAGALTGIAIVIILVIAMIYKTAEPSPFR